MTVRSYVLFALGALLETTIQLPETYAYIVIFELYRYIRHLLEKKRAQEPLMAASIEEKHALVEKTETLIESIERRTGHCLTIESTLTDDNLARCDPQCNSYLFQLPRELRDMIYEYASTPCEDPKRRWQETSFYYRPGHTAILKTYTSLLFTCRRVWLEANALPMKLAEHPFWFQRGPYDRSGDIGWAVNIREEQQRYHQFLKRLTVLNLQNLTCIHLFMQMFQTQQFSSAGSMELFIWDHYLKLGLRPKVFHVTVRQSDWWDWETDQPLSLDERWVQSILDAPQLGGSEMFKLELETLASKKHQLDSIVERLKHVEGKLTPIDPTDGNNLHQNQFIFATPPRVWQWSRSPKLDGKSWQVFEDVEELKLHVVTLSWRKQPSTIFKSQGAVQDTISRTLMRSLAQYSRSREQFARHTLLHDTTPVHTPAMIMKARARRALMNETRWNQVYSFSQYAASMQAYANELAIKIEGLRKEQFGRMFGDMEANQMMQQWKSNGSLLKFVGSVS